MNIPASDSDKVQLRPWRDIADELAGELDPERVRELVKELSRALAPIQIAKTN